MVKAHDVARHRRRLDESIVPPSGGPTSTLSKYAGKSRHRNAGSSPSATFQSATGVRQNTHHEIQRCPFLLHVRAAHAASVPRHRAAVAVCGMTSPKTRSVPVLTNNGSPKHADRNDAISSITCGVRTRVSQWMRNCSKAPKATAALCQLFDQEIAGTLAIAEDNAKSHDAETH